MVKKIDISPLKEPDPDLPPRSLLGRLGRAEKRLAKIAAIYNTETKIKGFKGTEATHAGYNLDGAIIDLKRNGKADKVIINTLDRVAKQLAEIGKVLGPDLIWRRKNE